MSGHVATGSMLALALVSASVAAQDTTLAARVVSAVDNTASATVQDSWVRVGNSAAVILREPIALDLRLASVPDALHAIGQAASVTIQTGPDVLASKARVSLHVANVSVADALTTVLEGTGLAAYVSLRGDAILVGRPPREEAAHRQPAATRTLTGEVTDSVSGNAVVSGVVSVAETQVLAPIHNDGSFRIVAPNTAVTLLFRSVGFVPQSVAVPPGRDTIRVVLARDYARLSQIVVTGQATGVERQNLPNSIDIVDSTQLERVPNPTIERAMQGVAPGVHISENSGAPGGGSIVRVRGITSIYGAFTPLYVVDGVIVSDVNLGTGTNGVDHANGTAIEPASDNQDNGDNRIADINAYDIESIEVLKGAAESAIYGSKAANGVVIITTKKGKEGAPQFNITEREGFSQLSHEFGHRCFTEAEAVATFGAVASQTWTPACHDFEKELYGGSPLAYDVSASVSGGAASTRYYVSLLDNYQGGIIPNTDAGKQSLRMNLDQSIGSRLHLTLNAQAVHSERDPGITQNGNNRLPVGGAIAYGGATWLDLQQRPDGSYPENPFDPENNPFQTVALFQNHESVWRSIIGGTATYDLYTSDRQTLRFVGNVGVDLFTQKNDVLAPPELYAEQASALPGASALALSQNQNTNVNVNLVHTYNFSGSRATSQIGMEYETQDLDYDGTLAQGLSDGVQDINQGLSVQVQENRQQVRDLGIFGQEEFLTLHERLLLTLGARADQSSNDGDPSRLYVYPKASASYLLPVLPQIFDELKVRFAAGYSGNEPLYGQKYTALTPGAIAGTVPTFTVEGTTAASNLQPERERELETGIDAAMLHHRLSVEFTLYEKAVTDLLLQRTLAPTTGFTSQFFNGGALRNRGAEISVTGVPVQQVRGLTWTTTATYYMSRCKITSLSVPAFEPSSFLNSQSFGYTFIQPGRSCTQIYGNDTLGAEPGDARLGALGTSVVRPLADAAPNFNASWNNTFDYRLLHVTFLWDAQTGGVLSNISEFEYDANGTSPDYLVARGSGQLTGQQRIMAFPYTARIYLQDAAYLKLRELTVGMDVPSAWLDHIGLHPRSVRLSVSGQNLFVFTPYHGTGDPEVNQVAQSAATEVPWDIWTYPSSRTFWFTVGMGL
jgi:TonB-dependent starch-binding outer membrane protein SusC